MKKWRSTISLGEHTIKTFRIADGIAVECVECHRHWNTTDVEEALESAYVHVTG